MSLGSRSCAIALALPALIAGACGGYPVSRRVAGDYCLDWHGRETYYFDACGDEAKIRGSTEMGPLDGVVTLIGWDDRYVIAQRAHYVNRQIGWYIIDTRDEVLTGPLDDERLRAVVSSHEELKRIRVTDVSEAWRRLK
jgi:hypothetical protein